MGWIALIAVSWAVLLVIAGLLVGRVLSHADRREVNRGVRAPDYIPAEVVRSVAASSRPGTALPKER